MIFETLEKRLSKLILFSTFFFLNFTMEISDTCLSRLEMVNILFERRLKFKVEKWDILSKKFDLNRVLEKLLFSILYVKLFITNVTNYTPF